MRTRQQALNWAKAQVGNRLKWGGYDQCVAWVRHYLNYNGLGQFGGVEGACNMVEVDWPKGVVRVGDGNIIQPGDIVVWASTPDKKSGHTGVVLEVHPDRLVTLDQHYYRRNPKIDKVTWPMPNNRLLAVYSVPFNQPAPSPTPVRPTTEQSIVGKTVYLSPRVASWRVYQVGSMPPRNPVARLSPKKFGGLQYRILAVDKAPNSVVIQTQMFGTVSLPLDKDAEIR